MNQDENYSEIADMATDTARKFTRDRIIMIMWMPLQLLYVEMAKRKEIEPLSNLSDELKRKYWNEVNELIPERVRCRKIWAAQALYMYDLITGKVL